MNATPEDCPCCHECLSPGADTDRALVVAFLGGIAMRELNVPLEQALCSKHERFAREAVAFTNKHIRGERKSSS